MKRLLIPALSVLLSACADDRLPERDPTLATVRQPGTGSSGGNPEVASIWFRTATSASDTARWIEPPVIRVGRVRVLFGKGGACPPASAVTLRLNRTLRFDDEHPVRLRGAGVCAIEFLPEAMPDRPIIAGAASTPDGIVPVALGRTHALRIDFEGSDPHRAVDVHLDELIEGIDTAWYVDGELNESVSGADRNRLMRNVSEALHVHPAAALAPMGHDDYGSHDDATAGSVSLVRAVDVPPVRSSSTAQPRSDP